MIVIQIILGLAAAWALINHVVGYKSLVDLPTPTDPRRNAAVLCLVAFILALGFLALTLA